MNLGCKLKSKAVFALVAGMAFLLFSSCQSMIPGTSGPAEGTYAAAVADYQAGRYAQALFSLKEILSKSPNHPEIQKIKYYLAFTYYHSGYYQSAIDQSTEWIRLYPESPDRYRIMKLIGDSHRSLGQMYDACFWMLMSLRTAADINVPSREQEKLRTEVIDIINESNAGDLKKIAGINSVDPFLPYVYQRLAQLAIGNNHLLEAKEYIDELIKSTKDQKWINKGNELLSGVIVKIEKAANVESNRIGCLLPLKGEASLYGEAVLHGIELGMDIFNKSSNNKPIELVIRNTNGSTEDTLAAIDDLVKKERVIAIVGPLIQNDAVAAAKKAQEYQVPIITLTQKSGITDEGDMVFRNFLTPSKEIDVLLKKAINDMGMKRFGIFYPDTPYGKFFMNLFWNKAEEMGGEITAVESYEPEDTDFGAGIKKMVGLYYPRPESVTLLLKGLKLMQKFYSQQVQTNNPDNPESVGEQGPGESVDQSVEAKDANSDENTQQAEEIPDQDEKEEPIIDFDAVFIPDNSQHVALIAPQFPFFNVFNVPLLGTDQWMSNDLLQTTAGYIQGAMFPVGFFVDNNSPETRKFVKLYEENFGKEPGVLAADGYDTIRMIKELLNNNDIVSRYGFQKALLSVDYKGVTGDISFGNNGEVEKEPVLLTVHGRTFQILK